MVWRDPGDSFRPTENRDVGKAVTIRPPYPPSEAVMKGMEQKKNDKKKPLKTPKEKKAEKAAKKAGKS